MTNTCVVQLIVRVCCVHPKRFKLTSELESTRRDTNYLEHVGRRDHRQFSAVSRESAHTLRLGFHMIDFCLSQLAGVGYEVELKTSNGFRREQVAPQDIRIPQLGPQNPW